MRSPWVANVAWRSGRPAFHVIPVSSAAPHGRLQDHAIGRPRPIGPRWPGRAEKSAINGAVARCRAVGPVHQSMPNERIAAGHALELARAPGVVISAVANRCISLALPHTVELVATGWVGDDAVSRGLALFVVEVEVIEAGTFPASLVERAAWAFVAGETPAEVADPVDVTFFDLIDFANTGPAEVSDRLPILGTAGRYPANNYRNDCAQPAYPIRHLLSLYSCLA
jgi:hypothetical protein